MIRKVLSFRPSRDSTAQNSIGSHDYLNRPEMLLARTLRERSISTSSILAQKLERMRDISRQELLIDEALSEVSTKPYCYEGKMLKKIRAASGNKHHRKRSKSMDATAHFAIK